MWLLLLTVVLWFVLGYTLYSFAYAASGPMLSPILMPVRIALGTVAWWETPVAVGISGATIYAVIRVAARIYTNALVRSGARISWRAALLGAPRRPTPSHR